MPFAHAEAEERIRELEREVASLRRRLDAGDEGRNRDGVDDDFRILSEHLADIIWLSSADQRHVGYLAGYQRVLGRPPPAQPSTAQLWSEIVDPGERTAIIELFSSAPTDPIIRQLRVRDAEGEPTWLSVRVVPILDDDGRHLRNLGIASDTTDQALFEEALRQSEERWRAVAENAFDHVVLVDRDGIFRYINRAPEGLREEDFLAKVSVVDTVEPACKPQVRKALDDVFHLGKPSYYEVHSSVTGRWYGNYAGPVRRQGAVTLAAILCQDITQRKDAEAEITRLNRELETRVQKRTADLEDANKELESFAYSISHDLRAPLRAIHGFSQVLLEDHLGSLDEEGRDAARRVHAAAARMGGLIDGLLDLARLSRADLSRKRVNLTDLATRVSEELAYGQPDRGVESVMHPTTDVEVDAHLILVVLQNLLENAWKYTSKQPRPTITFGSRWMGGEQQFYVADNGVGFDVDGADRLFGAFQRLHHADDFEGTGIGLATVRRIIHRHGGRVWATASPGAGATFYFTVCPAEPPASPADPTC